ncbi:MAG: fibrillarin-like rRNA/tRNA 2'-O-methyltransferase [Nanoarchaeota archaeon]|nr:fibrillarin-like rRNA/tRNA 2'-O-methyltransferase [Nanoarchaeota archaeon]MBU1031290.1 fibrillarin-like rRNA/tRNA 2'-O-methyltransferase [Nanoarchaeota archaeon]MBU1849520.1 fibrillarin-like rRNA/tRNA 2'-O-methyltransferase [Nanoarchaeota archaeon]
MKPLSHKFSNIFSDSKNNIFTKSISKEQSFFDEKVVREGNDFFREWDPNRSKIAAALKKGLSQLGIKEGQNVLYLGAAHGYTPSFVSDIVGQNGFVFGVEFSPEVARDLVFLSEKRTNIAPIVADANHPEEYKDRVLNIDVIFQDISQKNQVEIFLKNCDYFLKEGCFGLLAIKARSIDVSKKPKILFKEVREKLEKHITIVDYRELDPFEKDHAFFVCKKR